MIPFPNKKYNVIYADPPWPEYGAGKIKRGADKHYNLMTIEEIKNLPVKDIAEENAHLYLWVTNSFLEKSFEVIKAWDFTYKTCITWAKHQIGLGQYFRGQTEHCLFCIRGKTPYKILYSKHKGLISKTLNTTEMKRQQGTTLIINKRGEHSCKPDQMRKLIEKVSPGTKRIELFARRKNKNTFFNKFENWDL